MEQPGDLGGRIVTVCHLSTVPCFIRTVLICLHCGNSWELYVLEATARNAERDPTFL